MIWRALIVDDDESVRYYLTRLLGKMGYDFIHVFERFSVALQMIQDQLFCENLNIIISDFRIKKEEMNGIGFLDSIKDHFPNARRLIYSANGSSASEAKNQGYEFIEKGAVGSLKVLKDFIRAAKHE